MAKYIGSCSLSTYHPVPGRTSLACNQNQANLKYDTDSENSDRHRGLYQTYFTGSHTVTDSHSKVFTQKTGRITVNTGRKTTEAKTTNYNRALFSVKQDREKKSVAPHNALVKDPEVSQTSDKDSKGKIVEQTSFSWLKYLSLRQSHGQRSSRHIKNKISLKRRKSVSPDTSAIWKTLSSGTWDTVYESFQHPTGFEDISNNVVTPSAIDSHQKPNAGVTNQDLNTQTTATNSKDLLRLLKKRKTPNGATRQRRSNNINSEKYRRNLNSLTFKQCSNLSNPAHEVSDQGLHSNYITSTHPHPEAEIATPEFSTRTADMEKTPRDADERSSPAFSRRADGTVETARQHREEMTTNSVSEDTSFEKSSSSCRICKEPSVDKTIKQSAPLKLRSSKLDRLFRFEWSKLCGEFFRSKESISDGLVKHKRVKPDGRYKPKGSKLNEHSKPEESSHDERFKPQTTLSRSNPPQHHAQEPNMSAHPTSPVYLKVILLGDYGVGKDHLLQALSTAAGSGQCVGCQCTEYRPKECVELTMSKEGRRTKMKILSTAGQERFRSLTSSYYRGVHGCLLLFNVTQKDSFDHVMCWYSDLQKYSDTSSFLLLGISTPSQSREAREVTSERAFKMAEGLQTRYLETTMEDTEMLMWIVDHLTDMVSRQLAPPSKPFDTITIVPSFSDKQTSRNVVFCAS